MGKSILLVDDSIMITSNLKQFLSDIDGINCIDTAATLPLAKIILQREEKDIVVLDISLPEGCGIDFLKWVKCFHPSTIVIMFSNLTDEVHRAAAHSAGATHFFDKSFEFEEIHQLLEQMAAA